MAWRRPGDRTLSETRMGSLLMHICVNQPQWVKNSKCQMLVRICTHDRHPTACSRGQVWSVLYFGMKLLCNCTQFYLCFRVFLLTRPISWEAAATHIKQGLTHLESLASGTLAPMRDSPDAMMRGYAYKYDLSRGEMHQVSVIWEVFNSLWRHRSRSTLVHVMACCLTAPSHYLN